MIDRPRIMFRSPRVAAAAFTLLELIICVALVLVLMLAITKIFSITSTTIGASQGFAAATRDARAAQAVFAHDIGSMASNTPWIWIRYDPPVPAFRNAVDEKADKDYVSSNTNADGSASTGQNRAKLTVDANGNGIEGEGASVPGEEITSTSASTSFAASNRNHRQDRFSFCARDRFYRETGNSAQNTLVSNMSSPEAWITYEHLVLPFTDGSFKLNGITTNAVTSPGDGSAQNNPQNFYASQWVLGRVAMLMVLPTGAPSATPSTETIQDANGILQEYFGRGGSASWTAASSYSDMSPLSADTKSTYPASPNQRPVNSARYDLIGIDVANAITRIKEHMSASASGTELVTGSPASKSTSTIPWYTNMLTSRFQVNPFTIKPISAGAASQQVPLFLPACSQFIVEFAGDFVSQTSEGAIDDSVKNYGLQPDGQIDFHFDYATQTRQIQWYGYPRSPSGNTTISAANPGDVVLLSDFVKYISSAGYIQSNGTAKAPTANTKTYTNFKDLTAINSNFASFEHYNTGNGSRAGYDTSTGNRALRYAYAPTDSTTLLGATTYYCAWGPDSIGNMSNPRPKMIRITVVIDRPELAGRTTDGQTFQYVFNLNQ